LPFLDERDAMTFTLYKLDNDIVTSINKFTKYFIKNPLQFLSWIAFA